MVRANQICKHPKRAEIDRAIQRGDSQRAIAGQFNLSRAVLQRYISGGCPDGDLPPKEAIRQKIAEGNEARALEGIKLLEEAHGIVQEAIEMARDQKNPQALINAAGRFESMAKLVGVRTGGTGDGSGLTTALEKIGKAAWKEEEAK